MSMNACHADPGHSRFENVRWCLIDERVVHSQPPGCPPLYYPPTFPIISRSWAKVAHSRGLSRPRLLLFLLLHARCWRFWEKSSLAEGGDLKGGGGGGGVGTWPLVFGLPQAGGAHRPLRHR